MREKKKKKKKMILLLHFLRTHPLREDSGFGLSLQTGKYGYNAAAASSQMHKFDKTGR